LKEHFAGSTSRNQRHHGDGRIALTARGSKTSSDQRQALAGFSQANRAAIHATAAGAASRAMKACPAPSTTSS
jgi:hypothetical protein